MTVTTEQPIAKSLEHAVSFIETQFPVAKISAESYKERMGGNTQSLTGLGKWWGRKPLVLVRATILGLLIPASGTPDRDREVFLKLMTMDQEGLWHRRNKTIPIASLIKERQPTQIHAMYLDESEFKTRLGVDLSPEKLAELELLAWDSLGYSEKLEYCERPEQTASLSDSAWAEINAHLNTSASSLDELVDQLGIRRFGHRPRVGDSFSGGGSIPFEAARMGCDTYASDLNPVAGLLTWAALNIVGGGPDVLNEVSAARDEIYVAVNQQISEWGIEHNEFGWRADAYLYCVEVQDPESGWRVPLAPSWVIGERTKTVAKLKPDPVNKRYQVEILSGVSDVELKQAKAAGTVQNGNLVPPDGSQTTPIKVIRGDGRGGLRMWENKDLVPRPDDVFQERLYCVRWVETYYELKRGKATVELTKEEAESKQDFEALLEAGTLRRRTRKHYRAPGAADFGREQRTLELLQERFSEWQKKGVVPSRLIEEGKKTDEPIRTRGWTHWHHLFTPRQLLLHGLLSSEIAAREQSVAIQVALLLHIGRLANWNSRLCSWNPSMSKESGVDVFRNQALNSLYNFTGRSLSGLDTTWFFELVSASVKTHSIVELTDARMIHRESDMWITDPPYADAVAYDELSEFFSAWYEGHLPRLFPGWYSDSKRALAVKGNDENFRLSMVDCYKRLAQQMPDNGLQVVMFTHQDAAVWADLSLILWAAGLRVTAAWCIATETDSALKQGNYVQGTVLLVLRKRVETEPVFLDEVIPAVEAEVRRQLDEMTALEDESSPNFADADYQLAAYAAALRVLTQRPIYEIDPAREIARMRVRGEKTEVEKVIEDAVRIACDHLVPKGLDADVWKTLEPLERYYLKGLEVESHGEHRTGVYQELARGYGAPEYDQFFASGKANEARLMTASEMGRKYLTGAFGATLLRQALYAVAAAVSEDEARAGLNWLHTEIPTYWADRQKLIHLLEYLARLEMNASLPNWARDAHAAGLVAGAVLNDHT